MTGEEEKQGGESAQDEPQVDESTPRDEPQVAEVKPEKVPSPKSDLSPEAAKIVEVVESGISDRLDSIVAGVNQTLASLNRALSENKEAIEELRVKTQNAVATMPDLINDQVEAKLMANIKSIQEQINEQFETKFKAAMGSGGGGGAAPGDGLGSILSQTPRIIEIINAFRQPTTDQAMMSQMSFVMKWHKLLSSLEKGGGDTDELSNRITETFAPGGQEAPGS
jgi:hypothetical protein